MDMQYPRLGAFPSDEGTHFIVWAPRAREIEVVLEDGGDGVRLKAADGYHTGIARDVQVGDRYRLRVDGDAAYPDPASRYQPEGVHGPSEVVDSDAYAWGDASWEGVARPHLVFYELHVGTFTSDGTFDAVRRKLSYLKDLGITAIELMPVADFPGNRNWGYDPAALYAPARTYGRPDDLRRLVDEAHQMGLAVVLDVIYNHLGPDGAYVAALAPMFTERHHTPWGSAINLDDRESKGVRALFIDNALHWLREYHFDGLRLDATHALIDDGPRHFLAELVEAVHTLEGPRRHLIAEDPRNVNMIVRPPSAGGYGIDAIWTDDFHHQIRNMTAGDREGYYEDYDRSTMHQVADTVRNGWFFDGRPSPTTGKPRGTPAEGVTHDQCVICIQNHDQVGNRPDGRRLTDDVDAASYRAASALLLFIPHLPLLFMGQEWGASSPFLFFTDHNEELGKLVTEGRRKEFESFAGFGGDVPDPQDPDTFAQSRLRWEEVAEDAHAGLLQLYRRLLALRPALSGPLHCEALGDRALSVRRGKHHLLVSLDAATALPFSEDFEVVLHTEHGEFVSERQPPEIGDGTVQFRRAGAVIGVRR